jgi:hypothetical protein
MCRTAYENSSVFQVLKMMPKVEDTEQYNNIQIKEDTHCGEVIWYITTVFHKHTDNT